MNDTSRYFAAALSAGAGVLHFVAAGMHLGSGIDVALFTAAGWAQLALAAALVVRPSRSVAVAIVAVSVGCIGAWAASRTVGLPWGEHRGVVESVGAADLLATTLEAGVVIALLAPVRVTSARNAAFSGLVALVAVGGLTTAVAATSGAEEHAHSHDDATHTHDESTAAADGHVHDETTGATGDDTTSHSHAGHVTQDCTARVTDEQRAAADRLVADTRAAVARYEDLSVAKAAGFIPITPEPARVVHYADAAALGDGVTLDPDHVESLVYAFGRDGHAYLLGAMYLLDDPNAVPPMPGGCLMQWHAHDNLCLAPGKGMVATVAADGSCPAGSRNQLTPMMLHVWSIDLSTGPFSELDQLRPAEVAAAIAARG